MRIRNWHKGIGRRSKHAYREDTKIAGVGQSWPEGDRDKAIIGITVRDNSTIDDPKGPDYMGLDMSVEEAQNLWRMLGESLQRIGKRP